MIGDRLDLSIPLSIFPFALSLLNSSIVNCGEVLFADFEVGEAKGTAPSILGKMLVFGLTEGHIFGSSGHRSVTHAPRHRSVTWNVTDLGVTDL